MEGVLADVEIQQPKARSLDGDADMVDAAPQTANKQERQKNDKRDPKEKKGKKEKKPKQGKEDDKKKKKRKHDEMNGIEESVKLKKAKQ